MIDTRIPVGLGPKRVRLLEVALAQWDQRVREQPPGSNRGPRVDLYLPEWAKRGKRGPAWCAFFAGRISQWALGDYLPGGHLGSCHRLMEAAKRGGRWVPNDGTRGPIPGDVFIMDTDGDSGIAGHTGFVLRVSEEGDAVNTVEGNCGHRVQLGLRDLRDPKILGFIETVHEEPDYSFERGVIEAKRVGGAATR
jgi:hypothetical protein